MGAIDVDDARRMAEELLAGSFPQRWVHVKAVAALATHLGRQLPAVERDLLIAAAWLHDIGYAPGLMRTGLHALDGARYLRNLGANWRLCILVAHHSGARVEAQLRRMAISADEFPVEESLLVDLLWLCDLTTGHDGRPTSLERRLAEIAQRYGPEHVVTLAMHRSRPEFEAVVQRMAWTVEGSVDPREVVVSQTADDAPAHLGMDVDAVETVRGDPLDQA